MFALTPVRAVFLSPNTAWRPHVGPLLLTMIAGGF